MTVIAIDCEPSIYMSLNIALDNFISSHHINVVITNLLCMWFNNDAVHGC